MPEQGGEHDGSPGLLSASGRGAEKESVPMFRHTMDQMTSSQALLDAMASAVLMAAALLPILTFATVTLR